MCDCNHDIIYIFSYHSVSQEEKYCYFSRAFKLSLGHETCTDRQLFVFISVTEFSYPSRLCQLNVSTVESTDTASPSLSFSPFVT